MSLKNKCDRSDLKLRLEFLEFAILDSFSKMCGFEVLPIVVRSIEYMHILSELLTQSKKLKGIQIMMEMEFCQL